jgi:hypothetical protein
MSVFGNPEIARNIRSQLRPDRMAALAAVVAILSVVAGSALSHFGLAVGGGWGIGLLHGVVYVQTLLLLLAGGLAAARSIQHERERNTFDFQRATLLTPLELTVGKLFGAPVLSYYLALCLMPAAIVGAAVGRASPSFVAAAYVIVLLGAIAFHAAMLVLSLVVRRDAAATIAVLAIVFLGRLPGTFLAGGMTSLLSMGSLTPFFAGTLLSQTSWAVNAGDAAFRYSPFGPPTTTDVLFGWPVHHFFVLVVLYLSFTAWCLLVVSRNIKRDPGAYELLTPREALAFTVYLNLILVGFLRWSTMDALTALGALVGVNVVVFFVCGLALLRGRDYVRRALARGTTALPPAWPGLYLGGGLLATGLVLVAALSARNVWTAPEDAGVAVLRIALCAVWVARDLAYLQWVSLLPRSRSVLTGLLSLAIFYIAVAAYVISQHLAQAHGSAVLGVFVPGAVLFTDPSAWRDNLGSWLFVLAAQLVAIAALTRLQQEAVRRFAHLGDAVPA